MTPAYSVEPLTTHDRRGFDCGQPALNAYLQAQAGQDMKRRVAACFVAIETATEHIAGFYTLSACHVQLTDISADWQKKFPRYPVVPAARLGRLAIDLRHQGQKLGSALLANAVARVRRSDIAAHLIVVDAKDHAAAAFYTHHGFQPDPAHPLRLYCPVQTLRTALGLT